LRTEDKKHPPEIDGIDEDDGCADHLNLSEGHDSEGYDGNGDSKEVSGS
jgi:hypothetical protein